MKWGLQQSHALDLTGPWIDDPYSTDLVKIIAGYAGTGKTELARHLVANARKKWLFAAFTGKATHVLRQRGCDNASTIHSLIYRPSGTSKAEELRVVESRIAILRELMGDKEPTLEEARALANLVAIRLKLLDQNKPQFTIWGASPLADPEVAGVVIDEYSMIDEQLARDLESFGKKILVLGDPFQLPPVRAQGWYSRREPDVMLTEVYRHGALSGILRCATLIREGGHWSQFESTPDCELIYENEVDSQELAMLILGSDQVLVGYNDTRDLWNWRYRELLGRKSATPERDDRVVCYSNDKWTGLFNGSQWVVRSAECDEDAMAGDLMVKSEDDGRLVGVDVWLHHFMLRRNALKELGDARRARIEMDWGYTLTVHKAQGSQYPDVLLKDEPIQSCRARWRYTGLTRASKKIQVYIPGRRP